ncbi:hypothetical protein [Streptomyces sp. NPDC006267]|uniref:hypothetical protein n=1 Tax=Streptomyces sp. NPDC006267 TaxID=3157173 RepID=UPI0033B479A3
MADEHYEWLDEDAAEKLLRGEPVDPVGDQARTDAFRLAEALGTVRDVPRPPAGELAGEGAVLAAFRQAGHGSGAADAGAGRPGTAHSVRIGSAPETPARRPRWSRPVRFGLVASLAGCALGGVAVAAGTGVFTGAFGELGPPTPAASVSAAATSGPLTTDGPADDPASPADPSAAGEPEAASSGPATRESEMPEESDGARTGDTGREDGEERPARPDAPGGDGPEETAGAGDGYDDRPGGSGGDTAAGDWYGKSVEACRDFRGGTLDDRSRRLLIRVAKGEKNLENFCDRVLDGGDGNGGPGGNSGPGGSGGNGSGRDDEDGGGENRPGDGGSRPHVSFQPAPRSVAAPATGGTETRTGATADTEAPPLTDSTGAASARTR